MTANGVARGIDVGPEIDAVVREIDAVQETGEVVPVPETDIEIGRRTEVDAIETDAVVRAIDQIEVQRTRSDAAQRHCQTIRKPEKFMRVALRILFHLDASCK